MDEKKAGRTPPGQRGGGRPGSGSVADFGGSGSMGPAHLGTGPLYPAVGDGTGGPPGKPSFRLRPGGSLYGGGGGTG